MNHPMNSFIEILKALADKNRIRIIKLLSARKMCVCELAFVLEISQPSVSRHLKKLKSVGLIGEEQDSFWSNYYIIRNKNPRVDHLVDTLGTWMEENMIVSSDLLKSQVADRRKLYKQIAS